MGHPSLATELGMKQVSSEAGGYPDRSALDTTPSFPRPVVDNDKDYFVRRDGLAYAGTHLIVDLWDATNLNDLDLVQDALEESARVAGATILHTHLHHFTPNFGISGVVVLAESHISIHTWPERGFAALDIFMCGDCVPARAIPVLKRVFQPGHVTLVEHKRGLSE